MLKLLRDYGNITSVSFNGFCMPDSKKINLKYDICLLK